MTENKQGGRTMQAAVMDRKQFEKSYRKYEAAHGREVTDIEIERSFGRYENIVLKGK
jgi:hypothetical protein